MATQIVRGVVESLLGHAAREPTREAIRALAAAAGGLRQDSLDAWVGAEFVRYLHEPARARLALSAVEGAGQGVFASRDIAAGELVTLYPGLHYPAPPPPTTDGPLGHSYLLGTALPCERELAYALTLADGAILDGTPACLAECCILRRRMPRTNALGHRTNHPPPGSLPNALVLDLREFPAAPPIAARLLANTPTVPSAFSHVGVFGEAVALDAADPRRAHRLVGLLAAVPLREGDELLLDYLRPPAGATTASWFAPVAPADKAAARALRTAARARGGEVDG